MNEGFTIFLNMDERKSAENEALIERIDRLLLDIGIEYTGISNMYKPVETKDRDCIVFTARQILKNTDWLKDKLACIPIMNQTDVCSLDQIRTDYMSEPSAKKIEYYEAYYQASHTLSHGIVVDEDRQLRDGYISYLIAKKYGIRPNIYEAFAEQPLKKVVRGCHVLKEGNVWRTKSDKIYSWNYTLKTPVVPGDILKVRTKKGQTFMCVHRIDYVTGKEFCKQHGNVIKHMRQQLPSGE